MAINYYEIFDKKKEKHPLDPAKNREFNYQQLKLLSAQYTQRSGPAAEIKLNYAKEAQKIFNTDVNYNKYRLSYIEDILKDFLEGALANNKLFNDDYKKLLNKGKKAGLNESEIDSYLKYLRVTISKTNRPDKTNSRSEEEIKKEKRKIAQEQKRIKEEERRIQVEREKLARLRKQKISRLLMIVGPIIILGGISYFILSKIQSGNGDTVPNIQPTIKLEEAVRWVNMSEPEYSKLEEAVICFKANIDEPESKAGLLKARDIFIHWAEDSPTPAEGQELFKKALECDKLAGGDKAQEINTKLEELYFYLN
jgi:hypothetical protein